MNIAERLVAKRRGLTSRKIIRQVMAWVLYIDLPWNVEIGENFQLLHRGAGVIIHPATRIGNNVTIAPYSGTGQLYPMDPWPMEEWPKVIIEDDVLIGVDVKVLAPREGLTIGKGTIVGAGSVLNQSTGPNEVWAGIPARCIRKGPPRGSSAYKADEIAKADKAVSEKEAVEEQTDTKDQQAG
jgi:serine O-acetyltransferase